jgi:hypothetical protein
MPITQIDTFDDIVAAWREAVRESDKRALWRLLARGGWLHACRDAVQKQDHATLAMWADKTDSLRQDIMQFNGPDIALMVQAHLQCGLAACGHSGQELTHPSPGFCHDLILALSNAPLRQGEQTTALTVLLVDTARNDGVVATLTLELIPNGSRALYPTPELIFLRDADFQQAETQASAATHSAGLWSTKHDVRWQLHRRDGKPLTTLAGPSMGAAFALGISKLCSP